MYDVRSSAVGRFFFYEMLSQDTIAEQTRYRVFGSLMVLAAAGVCVLSRLQYPLPKKLQGPQATIQLDGNLTGYAFHGLTILTCSCEETICISV